MSKFDEQMDLYKASLSQTMGVEFDADKLTAVAKGLGPSIYLGDASKVSCSDPEELARVKNNYLIKKLGLADGEELDAAIQAVCEEMGSSNRNKYRAVFYYLLQGKLVK